jgi:outer membrane protein OmpA-like peptidoglycan-associated protein
MPPAGDQEGQPTSAEWAVGYGLVSFLEHKSSRAPYTQEDLFSPTFVRNSIKRGSYCWNGISTEDVLSFLNTAGVVPLSQMPYLAYDCATQPPQAVRDAAMAHRLGTWRKVGERKWAHCDQDLNEIRSSLNSGHPVVAVVRFPPTFHLLKKDRFQWDERRDKRVVGKQVVLIVGYDDSKRFIRILNSWGRKWGDGGYGRVAYESLPNFVRSLYVVEPSERPPPPPPDPVEPSLPGASPQRPLHVCKIYFDFNSERMRRDPDTREALDAILNRVQNESEASELIVTGHADQAGGEEYNLKLAEDRAKAVAKAVEVALKARNVTLPVSVRSYGYHCPAYRKPSGTSSQANRRVEVFIRIGDHVVGDRLSWSCAEPDPRDEILRSVQDWPSEP